MSMEADAERVVITLLTAWGDADAMDEAMSEAQQYPPVLAVFPLLALFTGLCERHGLDPVAEARRGFEEYRAGQN